MKNGLYPGGVRRSWHYKEVLLLLSLVYRSTEIMGADVLWPLFMKAVMTCIPAHHPAIVAFTFIVGIGVLVLWTLKYEHTTSF